MSVAAGKIEAEGRRPVGQNIWYYVLIALAASVLFSPVISFGSKFSGQDLELKITDFLLLFSTMLLAVTVIYRGSFPLASAIRLVALYFSLYLAGVFTYYFITESPALSPVLFWGKQTEYFLLCYLAYYAVLKNPGSKDSILRWLVALFLVSYFVNALFIVYQVSTGDYHGVARAFERRASVIFDTAVGASGQFMLLSFLFLMALREASRTLKSRAVYYALFPVILFSLAGIGSTSAALSLIFVASVVALAFLKKRIAIKTLLGASAAVSVAAAMIYAFRESFEHQIGYMWQRFSRVYDLFVSLSLSGIGNRYHAWQETGAKIMVSPLIGHGTSAVPMTDNQYLKILGEFGAVGLAVFLAVFLILLRRYWIVASAGRGGGLGRFALFMAFATVSLLFHGLLADIFQPSRIMEPYWLLTGVFWGLYCVERRRALQHAAKGTEAGSFNGRVHAA